jgi:hypothetical protein
VLGRTVWVSVRLNRPVLAVVLAVLCAGCVTQTSQSAATPSASSPVPAAPSTDPYGWIDAAAARRVAAVVKLIDAYNSADMAGLQGLLAPVVAAWADCAGDKFVAISATLRPVAKAETIAYFQARFADHDRLEVGRITTAPANGGEGVGIQFARRSNDSLRALGFPDGIVGPQTNKTVFDASGLVVAFANASGPQDCHPK